MNPVDIGVVLPDRLHLPPRRVTRRSCRAAAPPLTLLGGHPANPPAANSRFVEWPPPASATSPRASGERHAARKRTPFRVFETSASPRSEDDCSDPDTWRTRPGIRRPIRRVFAPTPTSGYLFPERRPHNSGRPSPTVGFDTLMAPFGHVASLGPRSCRAAQQAGGFPGTSSTTTCRSCRPSTQNIPNPRDYPDQRLQLGSSSPPGRGHAGRQHAVALNAMAAAQRAVARGLDTTSGELPDGGEPPAAGFHHETARKSTGRRSHGPLRLWSVLGGPRSHRFAVRPERCHAVNVSHLEIAR